MPTPVTPKHVIWITTDHMRYDCIAANGNPAMHTPAMDRLVRSGVNFHQCYTQNPMCMPSRCSFMTGLYPTQTGVTDNGICLPPDFETTVARAFKAGGYQTVQIGKLHFQPHENLDYDPRPRHTYGFDVFYPSEERGNYRDPWFNWLSGKYPQYESVFRCPRSTDPARPNSERNPQVIDAPWQASQAGWIVETAEQYLASRRNTPSFLHLGFYNPHPPLIMTREAWEVYENADIPAPRRANDEWRDKPEPLANMLKHRADWSDADFITYRRAFYALVTEVDFALGHLIAYLEQNNLLDDTLLIFSSDHGDFCGDHGITHKSAAYYDEVMRVPLVLHWPRGLGQTNRNVHGLVEMVDLLPTLLGLCNTHIPSVMAGQSYADTLLAGGVPVGRDNVFAYHGAGQVMLRTKDHKYVRYDNTGGEVLYDLADPQHEVVNHADDVSYLDVLETMRHTLLSRTLQAGRSGLPRRYNF